MTADVGGHLSAEWSVATPRASDTFGAQFGAEESSIRAELEQYNSGHSSLTHDTGNVLPERLTPLMFTRPHVCTRISSSGLLVKVEPNNPQEGQTATIELHSLAALLRDTRDSQELAAFCEKKIAAAGHRRDIADTESYVLLREMLVLLLRQKGQVEGSDLAELLLRHSGETAGQMGGSGTMRVW